MLEQLEGSQAVARAVAMCRPEVISAYPISPQTHIVEALSDMVRTGELEAVRVPDGGVRVRGDVGLHRRLGHRGAHVHRDREPGAALHGRGAVQRLGARAADRDDARQPRDRGADQHLERPLRLDVAARLGLDPALRGDQPGGRRPAPAGVSARRDALAAGDGVHGRLHPHPRLRGGRAADPGAGRRVRAAVRAPPGPRSGGPGDDRGDGRAGGVHRGQVPDAREAGPGPRRDSRDRRRLLGSVRAAVGRAAAQLPGRGRGDDRGRARLGHWARSRTSSTSCASRA